MSLPTDSAARKDIPLARGCLDYFPDALAEVARLSQAGNDKHNPGQPLHWSREKSSDHADCIMRHLAERGKVDDDGFLHDVKVAWRALANLQLALEARREFVVTPEFLKKERHVGEPAGWIKWAGGVEPPVPGYTLVDVQLRTLGRRHAVKAPHLDWERTGGAGDILEYRISPDPEDLPGYDAP